jgi:hypothetical protein
VHWNIFGTGEGWRFGRNPRTTPPPNREVTSTPVPRWRLAKPTRIVAAVAFALVAVALAAVSGAFALGQSFGPLPIGFTQSLYASALASLGGIASAPNGDLLVDECAFSGSPLHRFSASDTTLQNGSTLHTETAPAPSNAGCGLANHPDGTLYSNASIGITNLDTNTAALLRTLGVPGNALGIAVDPQTNHLAYVAADCRFTATCTLVDLDPATGNHRTLISLTASDSQLIDGLAFDPSGNFLFLANRAPLFRLTILNRQGALVRHVALPSQPDGLAVHGSAPAFVLTNNTDGTLTRLDFPNGDYASQPNVSTFSRGGFRGDLASVGQDGCLYVSQAGTRFDDGTLSTRSSLVRICGQSDFSRPPGVLAPTATSTATTTSTPTATATSSPTATASVTPTPSPSPTQTPTSTPTPTASPVSTGSCSLYPIAVSAQALANLPTGGTLTYMVMGTAPGDYGWLTWVGSSSQLTLINSLTPPGDSQTYVDPLNLTLHSLSAGDWVRGRGQGITPMPAMLAALNTLQTLDISVPVWDSTQLQGATPLFHVSSFATVRLTGFNIPNQRISVRYLGPLSCT